MSSNSVCNHNRDETNQTPAKRSSDFVNHLYDYRPNWTTHSPFTIINFTTISTMAIIIISDVFFMFVCHYDNKLH